MAETATQSTVWEERLSLSRLASGTAAGLLAGVAMGVLLQLGTDLMSLIGGFTGARSVVVGWILHLLVSGTFGAMFAVFVALPMINSLSKGFWNMILLAVVHAHALSFVTIGFLIPFAVAFLGPTGSQAPWPTELVPSPEGGGLLAALVFGLAHLAYGLVLGATYYHLHD